MSSKLAALNNIYNQMTSSIFSTKDSRGNKEPIPIDKVSNGFENIDYYVSNLIANADDLELSTSNDMKILWGDIAKGMYTENPLAFHDVEKRFKEIRTRLLQSMLDTSNHFREHPVLKDSYIDVRNGDEVKQI